jgi:hypothetical protein
MAVFAALLVGILVVVSFIWCRSRNAKRQLAILAGEVAGYSRQRRRKPQKAAALLSRVFVLLQKGIAVNDTDLCYRAVDILKTAYSEGVMRTDETAHIVSLAAVSMRERRTDITGQLVDAIRPIVKQQTTETLPATLDQLRILAVIALREKQNFIADKAAGFVYSILEKEEWSVDPNITAKTLAVIRSMGTFVIRRRDTAMLREMTSKLIRWYQQTRPECQSDIMELTSAWLHRILYNNDLVALEVIEQFLKKISETKKLEGQSLFLLIEELKNLAGTSSLNPNSPMTPSLITMIIELGAVAETLPDCKKAVRAAGEVVRLSIYSFGMDTAFPVLVPLFNYGRKLLVMELKIGGITSEGSFRQQALFLLVKECISIMEFSARQGLTGSTGDAILALVTKWEDTADLSHSVKSFKKYCRLLLVYRNMNRRQRRSIFEQQIIGLPAFSEKEQERLGFIVGGAWHELLPGISREI